jgi:hypothetical protein
MAGRFPSTALIGDVLRFALVIALIKVTDAGFEALLNKAFGRPSPASRWQ